MTANLVVRNIEPEVVQALKQAAARHGRSAEAEHREILRAQLTRPARRSFKDVLGGMPNVGTDEDFNFRNAQP
ncbi:MAG TPA: DNA-binding protein [Burkholderiaceae bacterium]|nr:DNA-binding protein [Burkholderiaceae bacterium]